MSEPYSIAAAVAARKERPLVDTGLALPLLLLLALGLAFWCALVFVVAALV